MDGSRQDQVAEILLDLLELHLEEAEPSLLAGLLLRLHLPLVSLGSGAGVALSVLVHSARLQTGPAEALFAPA